jgi:hypothetical protein
LNIRKLLIIAGALLAAGTGQAQVISALPAAAGVGATDIAPFSQGATTRKVTAAQIREYVLNDAAPLATDLNVLASENLSLGAVEDIGIISQTGSITLFAGTDIALLGASATLNGVAIPTISSTDTLTNKTISGASNTLTNIGNGSLTNSTITINGQAVSLGGTSAPTQTTVVASDVTGIGTTYQDVTGLGFAVEANATYEFEFSIAVVPDATTTGVDVSVNGPASPTAVYVTQIRVSAANLAPSEALATTYDFDTGNTASISAFARVYRCRGLLVNGANAGTLIARVKREAVGSLSVLAGSYGVLRRIN